MKKIMGLFLLFSFTFIQLLPAQNIHIANLRLTHEKIYIHFDKPYYAAGETIWFKAYMYNNGLPSISSTNFYLQLEDVNGNIIETRHYPVIDATATGDIFISESLPQGYYTLRAVTNSNAADDSRFAYSKNVLVLNTATAVKDTGSKKTLLLQFFPESGHLIDRIKTQVAFKATDQYGAPVEVDGLIKTDSATVTNSFTSYHDGIGKLSFTPHLHDQLFAELEFRGKKYKFPLPAVEASGIYLKLAEADSGKIFEITRSINQKELFDTLRLVVKMNYDTVYTDVLTFGNEKSVKGILKTMNIPSGILHFIVLNKDKIPLAERLSFVNNEEYKTNTELVTLKRSNNKRGLNSFEIKFNDSLQHSISVAVTDLNTRNFTDKESIYSRFLLTADLKGYVYNPAYYFENNDERTRLALDNLMLTHGWTRYNWITDPVIKDSVKKDAGNYLLTISGTVKQLNNAVEISKGTLNILIISADSSIQSYVVPVKPDGHFLLDSLMFFGDTRLYYTYNNEAGKTVAVNITGDKNINEFVFPVMQKNENNFSLIKPRNNTAGNILNGFDTQVNYQPPPGFDQKMKLLAPVILKTKMARQDDKINKKYAGFLFGTSGKLVLDNIKYPTNNKSLGVIDYVLMNVRTIGIYKDENILVNKKNFSLESQHLDNKGNKEKGLRYWTMDLFLDERLSSLQSMQSITMDEVAMIKIYETGFVGVGSAAPGGAVSVYLKKFEDKQPQQTTANASFVAYKGYSVLKEFYNPDYSIPEPATAESDNRYTLYWNPFLHSESITKNTSFSFFNNDISKKLSIIVEGFDAKGRLIHYENKDGE